MDRSAVRDLLSENDNVRETLQVRSIVRDDVSEAESEVEWERESEKDSDIRSVVLRDIGSVEVLDIVQDDDPDELHVLDNDTVVVPLVVCDKLISCDSEAVNGAVSLTLRDALALTLELLVMVELTDAIRDSVADSKIVWLLLLLPLTLNDTLIETEPVNEVDAVRGPGLLLALVLNEIDASVGVIAFEFVIERLIEFVTVNDGSTDVERVPVYQH